MRVLLVGLGTAAALTAQALRDLAEDIELDGVDPAGNGRGIPCRDVFPSFADVPRARAYDFAIVATPTPTHADVCRALLAAGLQVRAVLCEKPIARREADVEALFADARDRGAELRGLYHYAHAPDLAWARDAWPSLVRAHGEPATFSAVFADSYGDQLQARTRTLGSAWVDEGINALSVLERLVPLERVVVSDVADHEALVEIGFRTSAGERVGEIRTTWRAERERKQTAFELADGTHVRLEHHAPRVVVGGEVVFEPGSEPRLERYRRMLAAHLSDAGDVYDEATSLRLHRLLSAADATSR